MSDEPGRNQPCPCGSGEKYKVCCGKTEQPEPTSEAPAEEAVEVQIEKEVRFAAQATIAQRHEDGLRLSFIVLDGGQPVQYTFQVGAPGKKNIMDAATGGLVVP